MTVMVVVVWIAQGERLEVNTIEIKTENIWEVEAVPQASYFICMPIPFPKITRNSLWSEIPRFFPK